MRAALVGSALAPTSDAARLLLVFRVMPQRPGNVGGEPVAKIAGVKQLRGYVDLM